MKGGEKQKEGVLAGVVIDGRVGIVEGDGEGEEVMREDLPRRRRLNEKEEQELKAEYKGGGGGGGGGGEEEVVEYELSRGSSLPNPMVIGDDIARKGKRGGEGAEGGEEEEEGEEELEVESGGS